MGIWNNGRKKGDNPLMGVAFLILAILVLSALAWFSFGGMSAFVEYVWSDEEADVAEAASPEEEIESAANCIKWKEYCLDQSGREMCHSFNFDTGKIDGLVKCGRGQAVDCENLCRYVGDMTLPYDQKARRWSWTLRCGEVPTEKDKPDWWGILGFRKCEKVQCTSSSLGFHAK
jgi:hypothetical protein